MTTPDFPDWTTPTGRAEQSKIVIPNAAYAVGATIANFDCSQYSALALAVSYPTSAAGDRYAVAVRFTDQNVQTAEEWVTFHSIGSYPVGTSGFTLHTPVRGAKCFVDLQGPGANTVFVSAVLSTRELVNSKLSQASPGQYPLVGLFPATSLGAGASSGTIYVPPSDRAISARLGGSAGPANYRLISPYWNNGALAASVIADLPATVATQYLPNIPAPRMALEVSATNTDTVARTLSFNLWDVS